VDREVPCRTRAKPSIEVQEQPQERPEQGIEPLRVDPKMMEQESTLSQRACRRRSPVKMVLGWIRDYDTLRLVTAPCMDATPP
jgi:hypothetical protein